LRLIAAAARDSKWMMERPNFFLGFDFQVRSDT
jgi:hypothetical protein